MCEQDYNKRCVEELVGFFFTCQFYKYEPTGFPRYTSGMHLRVLRRRRLIVCYRITRVVFYADISAFAPLLRFYTSV